MSEKSKKSVTLTAAWRLAADEKRSQRLFHRVAESFSGTLETPGTSGTAEPERRKTRTQAALIRIKARKAKEAEQAEEEDRLADSPGPLAALGLKGPPKDPEDRDPPGDASTTT